MSSATASPADAAAAEQSRKTQKDGGGRSVAPVGVVKALGTALGARVCSEHYIDSLARCVVELVQNSVDAGASSIEVHVNPACWSIRVADNGRGVREDEFLLVGERYSTNKARAAREPSFGFRGEALASIAQVAENVEITSRHCHSKSTFCKRIRGGRSSVTSAVSLHRPGTVVKILGLFHNTPVRRKHLSPSLELENLRNRLNCTVLPLPHVSLSLHDSEAGSRLLHVPVASSLLARYHQLYGTKLGVHQAHLELKGVKISALFGLQPSSRNLLQLIYVNRAVADSEKLHNLVQYLLSPGSSGRERNSFYVIAIECDNVECAHKVDPNKVHVYLSHERRVRSAITSIVATFLSSQGLNVSHCHLPTQTGPFSSTKPSSSTSTLVQEPPLALSPVSSLHPKTRPSPCIPTAPIANHWRTMSNPATSQTLKLHPVSGSTLLSQKLAEEEKEQKYQCVILRSNPSEKKSMKFLSSSFKSVCSNSCLVVPGWVNPTFTAGEETVLKLARKVPSHNSTHCKFTKESLKHTKVLGQVDKKFIICVFGGGQESHSSASLLVALDQHATHERIRLESFIKNLRDEEERVKMVPLIPPLPLHLTVPQNRVARNFSGKLAAIGVQLQWKDGQPVVCRLPAILAEREIAPPTVIQEMVQSHLEVLASTGGGGLSGLPSSLALVLHSRACHGAIRFGDSLELTECQKLISSLAECSLPFQCAHGRPSLAPLIDLNNHSKRCPSLRTPFPSQEKLRKVLHS